MKVDGEEGRREGLKVLTRESEEERQGQEQRDAKTRRGKRDEEGREEGEGDGEVACDEAGKSCYQRPEEEREENEADNRPWGQEGKLVQVAADLGLGAGGSCCEWPVKKQAIG